jgi:curved DNA-binding protein
MSANESFVNYYEVLQVHPDCDPKMIEASFRNLAKKFHPDHPETADVEKFNEVLEAHRHLRNADTRAEYDANYFGKTDYEPRSQSNEFQIDEKIAVNDADSHAKFLMLLYKNRRLSPLDPGVAAFTIQEMLHCSSEQFEFHRWYLKSKGLIEVTEQGALAITIDGVEHVISMSKIGMSERLLLEQPSKIDPK